MKRKICLLGMAGILATLLAFPIASPAAMWVGGELGVNIPIDSEFTVNGYRHWATSFNTSVIGGATIGYDFINTGFLGYQWPDWMKYFTFAMDFTYNRHNVYSESQGLGQFIAYGAKVAGYEATWSFLFIGHYGFLPDSEVPSGRINPFIGVGPGIVFSALDFNGLQSAGPVSLGNFNNRKSYVTSTNIALVAESGIRWMALKNVSIDTFLRYRLYAPSYNIDNVTIKTDALHQLSLIWRANYHF
jgi:hypothetical protein